MDIETIIPLVFIAACTLVLCVFAWKGVFLDKNGHLSPVRGQTSSESEPFGLWRSKTETRNEDGGPWFLVVYGDKDDAPFFVAADEILRFTYNGLGEMKVQLKHCVERLPDGELLFDLKHSFEFLSASRIGDSLLDAEKIPTARETSEYWHQRFKERGLLS